MNNIFNRLTKNAKEAIRYCQKISHRTDLKAIDSVFLIKAILAQKGSLGRNIIQSFNIDEKKIDKLIKTRALEKDSTDYVSVHEVTIKAFQLALISKNSFVGTEHLVYGLLSIPNQAEKFLPKKSLQQQLQPNKHLPPVLNQKTPPLGDLFGEINMLIENFFSTSKDKPKKVSFLQSYCTDLTNMVNLKDHFLVGRKQEMERISNILGRKIKNNPVLVGDPGVGKTAIVEGLALKIKEGKAPFYLSNKKILSLDLGSLIAGTTFRGEFESRLKEIIAEAKKNKQVILFIDEIHNLVGAGNAVGGMDAANLLKPALSRGEIQVIGATTYDEYRKYIEKDAALERRFQPVMVHEPTVQEAAEILKGIKKSYEHYHNITITDAAISQSAYLAKRYLHDRFLPDSAIDLIDETAARIRAKTSHMKIFQQLALKQNRLDEIINEKEVLVMNDRYEEAIHLREQEKVLQKELQLLKKKQKSYEEQHPIVLNESDVQHTISLVTKIPTSLISCENNAIVSNTKQILQKELIGQAEAVNKISQTLTRQFCGIGNPNRPLGSFLFIGPTGVGKTLTAKLLAKALSPAAAKDALIQINMSEFMERHSVSRLLGAPAGYVGYEESGELSEKVRRNPYSVVLFDEIEKADPAVLNILLQILEEGALSDSKGRSINFKNTVIILTSNIGTTELNQISSLGFQTDQPQKRIESEKKRTEQNILEELNQQLPVELINRLDHIIVYNPLSKEDIKKVTDLTLERLSERLKEKNINLKYAEALINFIAQKSLNAQQGARLVKRKVEELVEPLVAEKILKNPTLKEIHLQIVKNKLVVK